LGTAGLEDFFSTVPEADVVHALPDGVCVQFDLAGEGGGIWTVCRQGDHTAIDRRRSDRADCELACSVNDFRRLLRGELDPWQGFVEGRLRVEGDVGLVLRLRKAIH
jgi:putative sterol carrier protein